MKNRYSPKTAGFTLVELLTVMVIILILAGLVLGMVGYGQKKAARARAEGEMKAIETALESYKSDNAAYPQTSATNQLKPTSNGDPTSKPYQDASLALYAALGGDANWDGITDDGRTNYMSNGFKSDIYGTAQSSTPVSAGNPVTFLSDPFGNSYGYSTANADYIATQTAANAAPDPTNFPGYNPDFDLWSTSGIVGKPNDVDATKGQQPQWIKNWQ